MRPIDFLTNQLLSETPGLHKCVEAYKRLEKHVISALREQQNGHPIGLLDFETFVNGTIEKIQINLDQDTDLAIEYKLRLIASRETNTNIEALDAFFTALEARMKILSESENMRFN